MWPEGQTDMMKLTGAFRDCGTAPNIKPPRNTFFTTTGLQAISSLEVGIVNFWHGFSIYPQRSKSNALFSVEVTMQPKLRGTVSS
jgi:hypothetical protein